MNFVCDLRIIGIAVADSVSQNSLATVLARTTATLIAIFDKNAISAVTAQAKTTPVKPNP